MSVTYQSLSDRIRIIYSAVVATTVNVLCELARQKPKDYLSLAPQLFHLLTSSTNNWMLIKIVKLVNYVLVALNMASDRSLVWLALAS